MEHVARRSNQIQSVQRALLLLEVVGSTPGGASAKQLSHTLEISIPAVYQILRTLSESGYVVHDRDKQRYVLGFKINSLNRDLHDQLAIPRGIGAVVRRIHEQALATAYLAVYHGSQCVVVHVEGRPPPGKEVLRDVRFDHPPHATAVGKLMLAGMTPDDRASHLVRLGTPRYTTATITDKSCLERELKVVGFSGLASDCEEFQLGRASMAVAIRDRAGRTRGAAAVTTSSDHFYRSRNSIELALRRGAAALTTLVAASNAQLLHVAEGTRA